MGHNFSDHTFDAFGYINGGKRKKDKAAQINALTAKVRLCYECAADQSLRIRLKTGGWWKISRETMIDLLWELKIEERQHFLD